MRERPTITLSMTHLIKIENAAIKRRTRETGAKIKKDEKERRRPKYMYPGRSHITKQCRKHRCTARGSSQCKCQPSQISLYAYTSNGYKVNGFFCYQYSSTKNFISITVLPPKPDILPEGKLAAAARGSKLLKNDGSCISITCSIQQTKDRQNE